MGSMIRRHPQSNYPKSGFYKRWPMGSGVKDLRKPSCTKGSVQDPGTQKGVYEDYVVIKGDHP